MKKTNKNGIPNGIPWNKVLSVMKLTIFFFLVSTFTLIASGTWSQNKTFTINRQNVQIKDVLQEIEEQSGYFFIYNNEFVDVYRKITVHAKDKDIRDLLDAIFQAQDVVYSIKDRRIILSSSGRSVTTQQQRSISGKVTGSSGEPIPGVTVLIKGTTVGTITSETGNYSLANVSAGATLVFSFVGMRMQELAVGTNAVLNVTMLEETTDIEEVVAVGYGTMKKVSLTGSVSNITTKDILTTKAPSLAVALAGKVPGLQIRQNNGLPGSFNTNINVRGMGTPLFVIDGVVRNEPTEFQKLNPEDIESISVLKDASAAIYGINSSNGAILVKTKAGSKGPMRISYKGVMGVSLPTQHTPMMNVSQYWEIRNEDGVNSGGTPYFSTPEALRAAQSLPYTNWYDETFKSSTFQHQHNIILEGGTDKINTYTSVGYMTDNGLLRSGDIGYEKYSFRNGTTIHANKNLTVDLSLSGYTDLRKQPGTWDDAFFYLNKAVHGLIPSETVFANNNPLYYNRPMSLNDNPVQFSQREIFGYGEWRDRFFQSTFGITYQVPSVKGLKLRVQGAYDSKLTIRTRVQKRAVNYKYSASTDTYTPYNNYDPSIQEENSNSTRANFQGQVLYNTQVAKDHNIDVVLVAEAREDNTRYLSGKRFYAGDLFTVDNIDRAPTTNQQAGGNTGRYTYMSFIGRLNYNFRSKYLLEFAFREDGSYRYAPDQRWGFFPVVSGGWRISEESFIRDNTPMISNLKLRASYGITGQDVGNPFQFVPGYVSYNGYVLSPTGAYVSGYGNAGLMNADLTWTTSKTTDIGIDVSLWKGMLDFTFDVYRRNRDGLLATRLQALPNTFGASLPQENLNSDRTDGFEFLVAHRHKIKDFEYGVSANMNIGRTQITYAERAPFRSSMDRWKNGSVDRWQDIGWGYQVTGQYQNYQQIRGGVIETTSYGNARTLPGDYIHLDVNGDGVISDKDRMPIFWNGQPKLNFGVTFFASWKGLDFNMLWQGAGMYSLKYNEILGNVLSLDAANSPAMYYDRWHLADVYDPTSEWISGRFPATRRLDSDNGANRLESDVQRVDATYARLKNIELGYTLPNRYFQRAGISKVRCYVSGFNLLVLCDSYLKSFDPEITDGNGFQYPLSKSYNIGIDITF